MPRRKLLLLILLLAVAGLLYWRFGHLLTWEAAIEREAWLRAQVAERPAEALATAFLLYVAVTGFSLPGALVLSLLYGWLFGFWRAAPLVSFASTAGATIAFLTSRYLFRDAVRARFGERLARFDEALRREGAFYLFTLRLIPAAPFFVVNLAMGPTPLRARTFWWVSQLGMLPGTCLYLYAASQVPSLRTLAEQGVAGVLTPQIVAALVALGVFPLIAKNAVGRWRQKEMMNDE